MLSIRKFFKSQNEGMIIKSKGNKSVKCGLKVVYGNQKWKKNIILFVMKLT